MPAIAFATIEPGLCRVRAVEIPVDRLDRPRVAADDERREILDDAGEAARRAVRVGDLRPADEPVVRRRLEEDPRPPAGVAEQRLERGDLHAAEDTDATRCAAVSGFCERIRPASCRASPLSATDMRR